MSDCESVAIKKLKIILRKHNFDISRDIFKDFVDIHKVMTLHHSPASQKQIDTKTIDATCSLENLCSLRKANIFFCSSVCIETD